MTRKAFGLWVLVFVLAALSVATISGQLRINATNQAIADQASAGQRGLDRQCRLLPIGRKLYAWGLANESESHITAEDFALVVSTAATACP